MKNQKVGKEIKSINSKYVYLVWEKDGGKNGVLVAANSVKQVKEKMPKYLSHEAWGKVQKNSHVAIDLN